jgi:hypothetical protein
MPPLEKNINLTNKEYKELKQFCDLNGLSEEDVLKKSYLQGFRIEKYGLLSSGSTQSEVEVVKEVIQYVDRPVEIIKEVETVKEVIKEVPGPTVEVKVVEYVDREVIKEVPVEKIVEKIVNIYDNTQIDELINKIKELESKEPEIKEVIVEKTVIDNDKIKMLTETLQKLKLEIIEKNKRIEDFEKIVLEFEKYKQKIGATYLRGSNLEEKL